MITRRQIKYKNGPNPKGVRKMRNLKLLCLMVVLNLVIFHPFVYADDISDYTVSVSDAQAVPGEQNVLVTVDMTKTGVGLTRVTGVEVHIDFNESKIEIPTINDVEKGTAIPGAWTLFVNLIDNNRVKIQSWGNIQTPMPSDQGELFKIYFDVTGGLVGDNIDMQFSFAELSDSNLQYSIPAGNRDPGSFEIIPVPAAYLKVTGGASMAAGDNNELTITAYTSDNNVATSYTGTKALTFSGLGGAPDGTAPAVEGTALGQAGNVDFTAGVSNANAATLIAYKAESASLDVSDGTIGSNGPEDRDLDVTVDPAALENLNYTQGPTDAVVDVTIAPAITVQLRDDYENIRVTDTSEIDIAIETNPGTGTLSGTTPKAAIAGVATFDDLSIDEVENGYTLESSVGAVNATSGSFNILAGNAAYLKITGDAAMTAGGNNAITITAYDDAGNVATGYTGDKSLTFSGLADAPDDTKPTVGGVDLGTAGTVAFTAGVANATLIAYKAESASLDVTDGTIGSNGPEDRDLDLEVSHADFEMLLFEWTANDTVAGEIITPAVITKLFDQYLNLCITDTSEVVIEIGNNPGGGTLSGDLDKNAASGVATFDDLSIDEAGQGYNLRATAESSVATSVDFNILPVGSPYLKITAAGTMAAGDSNDATITAYDADDLVDLAYTGDKSLTFSGLADAPDGTKPRVDGVDLGAATTVAFTDGVGTATLIAYKAESASLDVTDGTIGSGGADDRDLDLTVEPGTLSDLFFVQDPSDTVAGEIITPAMTVVLTDSYRNIRTADTSNVAIAVWTNPAGGTLSGVVDKPASQGVATFDDISIDKAGDGYVLEATTPALPNVWAVSGSFNIVQGQLPPDAIDDRAITDAGVAVDIPVLTNDFDPNPSDTITIDSVTQPEDPDEGTAEIIESDTKVRFTPGTAFSLRSSFTYTITDGNGGFDTATVLVQERSACPWPYDVDPDYQYSYPIYGWAKQAGVHLAEGDWVGAFDVDGNCYGAAQYKYNVNKEYTMSAYAESVTHSLNGFQTGERMYFRFWPLTSPRDIEAISVTLDIDNKLRTAPHYYPQFTEGTLMYDGNPVEVNLVTAVTKDIVVYPGWNFISFNIQPDSTVLEEAFRTILTGTDNHLEYASSHNEFWYRDAAGGSLTNVDGYNSYYLRISDSCPVTGCTLTITGLQIELPYTFNLTQGWNNISYLYDNSYYALYNGAESPPSYIGIFDGISGSIVWIKGPAGSWTMPGHGELLLENGKGLFIKAYSDTSFTYEEGN